jgi:hypothetical protein
MRRRHIRRHLVVIAGMAMFIALIADAASAPQMERIHPQITVQEVTTAPGAQPYSAWKQWYRSRRSGNLNVPALTQQAQAGTTIPFWTAMITSPLNDRAYLTSMVGTAPQTKISLNIRYVPIVLRLHFADGTVLDPTTSACGDTVAITTRFFNSPLFVASAVTSNGVNVGQGATGGAVQLVNGFQRANYWSVVAGTPYGVNLIAASSPVVVDADAPAGSTVAQVRIQCGSASKTVALGQIDIDQYDALIGTLIQGHAAPSQLPIVLTYNVVQTEGGDCCILGYHSAIALAAGTQTYAVGSYIDSGIFAGVDDIVVWAHELAEWMDDPFVQAAVPGGGSADLTPPWGHVGQVSGCMDNLEVGDPLSGTEFAVNSPDGFHYHTQDLAFVDWFYRTPARGAGGKYSFAGTFTGVQGACN